MKNKENKEREKKSQIHLWVNKKQLCYSTVTKLLFSFLWVNKKQLCYNTVTNL